MTVVHKCTTVRHALSAERSGVDVVSIDGFECAGHPWRGRYSGLVLIPIARKHSKFHHCFGWHSAMAAVWPRPSPRAEGINMGTRFVCTREAPVHESLKQALRQASERDTNLNLPTMNTRRVSSGTPSR